MFSKRDLCGHRPENRKTELLLGQLKHEVSLKPSWRHHHGILALLLMHKLKKINRQTVTRSRSADIVYVNLLVQASESQQQQEQQQQQLFSNYLKSQQCQDG
mmetsp:Transcript_103404/g.186593  ORF Transcript_103404/g.186593 Transcript_103404/m.186593 type:complete len:102 (-) Transcript_103404:168-473(-)